MRSPLEKYYFKKKEMKNYWDKTIARYESYLTKPDEGHTWVSFSFKSSCWWEKNANRSLVMLSL